ncbi:MAG: hypothetical protein HY678_03075 [Chloroflexi bacterium]|nr:hypothetical protein [Chloroflexota bacterium]
MMRAATLTLLLILSGLWTLSTAELALAKPYGPPSWATLSGPGLPEDVFLSIDRASGFGTFEATCISGPRQATPPRQDWTGWQKYEATVFYAIPIESGRQAFVTKQTLYINGGLEGVGHIHSSMTILDQAGQGTGWGDCREKWVLLTRDQLAVVMEQVDRYSNIQQMMVFGCRWAGPGYGNPYKALTTPSCL